MVNDSFVQNDAEEAMEGAEEDEDGGMRIGDIYIPPPPLPACTFDATGPRLIINDIKIENFKSYAGKVSLGPFQKNLSAVVGANGSGKSNVIDSMLFVFGYRAQRIRSKTVGILIHNSEKHPNLTSCNVSVFFRKIVDKSPTEYELVEGTEFVVSRTAFKDNSSFYTIDGRRVQFKEVSRLLRSRGIDLDHNRFLILQGEVEQISLMKPKAQTEHDTGMLEFLEDIIGSGRLKDPTQQFAMKVEELNEMRCEKLNRVKAVEKEKDDLEGAKEEAMEYIRTKNKITLEYNIIHQCRVHRKKIIIKELQNKKKGIEESMSDLFDRVKEIDAKYKEKNSESAELNQKLNVALKAIEDAESQFAEYDKLDTRCRQDLKNASSRMKELVTLVTKEKAKLEDLVKSPDRLTAEIAELNNRRVKLVEDKAKVETAFNKVMASLHSETKAQREQKDKHEAKLMQLQKGRNEAKSKMDIAKVELDLYLKNEQDEKNKLLTLQDTYKSLVDSLKETEIEIHNLTKKQPELEHLFTNSKRDLETVSVQEIEIVEQLRLQRAKVEEVRATMQMSRSRGRLLEALMQEKNSGRIPGIIGRLGDLGAIDEKYDVAISTACGSLENIVTDTLDTAQQCIQLMKRQNLGQATFIGLDKMQVWKNQSRQKINTPQNVPRLFDLIKVKDESVLPAFYFALRDTLVANDIGQATEIGLRGRTRHRVVTLKGELIDTSGTMSGGGSRPIRGRMGSSVVADAYSPQQVQNMDAEVDALHGRIVELRTRKAQLEDLVRQHQHAVEECRHSHRKCRMDVEALTRDEPVLKASLREQQERTRAAVPDARKVQQLTKHFDKFKEDFQKLDDASSAVVSKVQSLNDEINEISGGRVQTAQKKLDDVNKALDMVDSTVTKDEVSIKTVLRNIAKAEEKITEAEAKRTSVAERISSFKLELEDFEVKAGKVNLEIGVKKEEAKEIETEVTALREKVKHINKVKAELDSQKFDVNHQLADLDSKIKDHTAQMKMSEKKLSALTLETTDDDGQTTTLPTLTIEEMESTDFKAVEYKITDHELRLKEMNSNLTAIAEFKRKEELYLQRVNELDAITRNRDAQRNHHENLRKQRLNEFIKGFQIISHKLKETYQMLTMGGDAELELVNSLDPFSDGIVFSVRPPRKSWKNISNLSGGEKTLSSLALVFALHYYKPTPFYVMDEIDAALDFRNVTIVGHYIKGQTKNAQFIVISLRNHLFELADRLIGIYKTNNTSHTVAVDPPIPLTETVVQPHFPARADELHVTVPSNA